MSVSSATNRPGPWFAMTGSVVLLLCALVYWPGLNGPMILDDLVNLDILRVLDEQGRLTLARVLAERGGLFGGRPVAWLSFVLNWQAFGADVWHFKLVNVLVHLCNGVLVAWLARLLLREGCEIPLSSRQLDLSAILIAALWLLTPMQVSTVLYVVQRMTMLAATFALAGLLAYLHGRVRLQRRAAWGWSLIAISLLVCWPLAALSKQSGVLLVLLLLSMELWVLKRSRPTSRWPLVLLATLCLLVVGAGVARFVADPEWVFGMYAVRDFSPGERLLTQPRVLTDYALNLLQLPGGTPLSLFHDDFEPSTGLLSPPSTLLHLIVWAAVPVIAWRLRHGAWRLVGFGLAFFLFAHALEAGPFPLEIYFEHRNYLPAFGLLFAVVSLLLRGVQRSARTRALVAGGCIAVTLAHGALSAARVEVWTSWEGIVEAAARSHPASARARAGAAIIEFTAGRLDTGLEHLAAVTANGGARMRAGAAIKALVGHCLAHRPPQDRAYAELAQVTRLRDDAYTINALHWYATVVATQPCPGLDRARVAELAAARVGVDTDRGAHRARWALHDDVARILADAGRMAEASRHLSRALAGAPTSRRAGMRQRLQALGASSS
jgi:hypothetical protein